MVAHFLDDDDEVAALAEQGEEGEAKRKPVCIRRVVVVAVALARRTWSSMVMVSRVLRSRKRDDEGRWRRRRGRGGGRGMWGGRRKATLAQGERSEASKQEADLAWGAVWGGFDEMV